MMGRRVAERKSWERKMPGARGDGARRVGCRCQAVSSGLRAKPGGSGVDRRFVARFKVSGSNLAGNWWGRGQCLLVQPPRARHHRAQGVVPAEEGSIAFVKVESAELFFTKSVEGRLESSGIEEVGGA